MYVLKQKANNRITFHYISFLYLYNQRRAFNDKIGVEILLYTILKRNQVENYSNNLNY